jgi:hypothetical protein
MHDHVPPERSKVERPQNAHDQGQPEDANADLASELGAAAASLDAEAAEFDSGGGGDGKPPKPGGGK